MNWGALITWVLLEKLNKDAAVILGKKAGTEIGSLLKPYSKKSNPANGE